AAHADVFRCETGGKTEYTDQPSDGCSPVAIRHEAPNPEALARLQQNREAYQQSMAQWREQRAAALQAEAQRPIIFYTPKSEPTYPLPYSAYPLYPFYSAYPFLPVLNPAPMPEHAPVHRGPARIELTNGI